MFNVISRSKIKTDASRDTSAFKAYDIRGVVGENIDANLVECVARAAVYVLGATSAVVGFDARETSQDYARAAARGCMDAGCDILSLGLCGTEEVYHACGARGMGLGIMVTASHNPIDHNGLKLVGPGARPLTETEFQSIRDLVASGTSTESNFTGLPMRFEKDPRDDYVATVARIALGHKSATATHRPAARVVFNCGNGAAGPTLNHVISCLRGCGVDLDAIIVQGNPDPAFPNGIPNPLLPENHAATASEVIRRGADFGVAFDGDFDRCFFFDARGQFVEGEYVVALLARAMLRREPSATIVHDPRVVYAVREAITTGGGQPIQSKTGHAYVKAVMRQSGAAYGGELSAHHYFRDFHYCDSGMIPWILVLELLRSSDLSLSALVEEMSKPFTSSGEINFKVGSKSAVFDAVQSAYAGKAVKIDEADGLSCDMGAWRFNVRASNTENLIRLNVEARSATVVIEDCIDQISKIIKEASSGP